MKRAINCLLLSLALGASVLSAQVLTPFQDAYLVPGNGSNFGLLTTITVGSSSALGLVQFDLSQLPAGVTAAQIQKATFTVFLDHVNAAGSVNIDAVTTPWTESTVSGLNPPGVGGAVATGVTAATAFSFISVDATNTVRGWLTSPATNNGFAIVANGGTSVQFDSKENTATSHPPTLTIVLANFGPTGPSGATGPAGVAGSNGATGPAGVAGSNGATGPAGVAGSNGATGPAGVAGSNGATGPAGVAGSNGATGPAGVAGSNGATGPAGVAGSNGATGPAGVAGSNGATGPAGVAGSNGATGPAGVAGSNGATGPAGVAGSNGATGPAGVAGSNGATGPAGVAGSNGATGPAGVAGSNGATGPAGATGPTGVVSVFGDGSGGALVISSPTTWLGGAFPNNGNLQFSSFTVNAGATLTVPSGTIIKVTGAAVILGTINVANDPGSAEGGVSGISASPAGFTTGNGGVAVSNLAAALLLTPRRGAGSGASGYNHPGYLPGAGGGGGGALSIRAGGGITLSGIINANGVGGNSGVANQDGPGGGGGGGGIVVLASSGNIGATGGTINAAGGSGGGATSQGDGVVNQGGGGGGGGIIHLFAPNVTGGIFHVNAGVGGGSSGTGITVPGGGGGASGGNGGAAAFNGTSGVVIVTSADPTNLFN